MGLFNDLFGFVLNQWDTALFIALMLFGIVNALQILDDKTLNDALLQNRSIVTNSVSFALWQITFNEITPTYRYELPVVESIFKEKYVIGINDIPFFDATDLIIMLPVIAIIFILLKRFRLSSSPVSDFFIKLIIMLLVITLSFLLTKFIEYQIYLSVSQDIGLSKTDAVAIRNQFLSNMTQLNMVFLMISAIGGGSIINKLRTKFG